jgi:uncharacterized linocin/CFP29 family protein
MAYDYAPITWTDEQWARVTDTIQQEANRARVAATFLPLYGPLPPDTDYVARDEVEIAEPRQGGPERLMINDTRTIRVPTLQVKVYVRGAQMADPELTSALQLFRRAANVLARLEDALIFDGQPAPYECPGAAAPLAPIAEILGGDESDGLLNRKTASVAVAVDGNALVEGVSKAIGALEADGHFGPFAVALGQEYFNAVEKPNDESLVLPQDRIIPFLGGGSLVRSSLLGGNRGVVVALGGSPVELVVATDMSVNFLQVTPEPMFVFRVFEKVVLRIKEPKAIVRLEPRARGAAAKPATPS